MQLHNEDRLILECLSKLNHGPWFMVRVATYLVTHWEITWKISRIDSLFLSSSTIVESTQFTFLFALGSMDQLMRFELSGCMRSEATFITNELFVLLTCHKMIWKIKIIETKLNGLDGSSHLLLAYWCREAGSASKKFMSHLSQTRNSHGSSLLCRTSSNFVKNAAPQSHL